MSYNREIWKKAIKTRCSSNEGFEYFSQGGCSKVYTHPEDPDVVYKIGWFSKKGYNLLRTLIRRTDVGCAILYDAKIIEIDIWSTHNRKSTFYPLVAQVMERVYPYIDNSEHNRYEQTNILNTELADHDACRINFGKRISTDEIVHLDLGCLGWQQKEPLIIPDQD